MTLFSRISKDCQNAFEINLILPTIKKINDYDMVRDRYLGVRILFDTSLIWVYCDGYWHIQASLLGFGIAMTRQSGY